VKKFIVSAVCAGLCAGGSAGAFAEEGKGIKMGGAKLLPSMLIEISEDDNIFSQPDNEESSRITRLKPRLEYLADNEQYTFSLAYIGDWGEYASSSDDDYDDHAGELNLSVSPSDIFRLSFNVYTGRLHEARGSLASEGASAISRNTPDEYDQNNYGVEFDFGRESAMFGASVAHTFEDKEYTNNDEATATLSRSESAIAGRLYSKLSGGKTRLFLEGIENEVEYDTLGAQGQVQDSEESTVSIGAEWEATAKTSGQIKVGRLNKDFDSGFDDDLSVWFVGVTWSPSDYSHFTLSSSQDAKESNGNGLYIEAQDHSLTWTHYWSDRFQSEITIASGTDEYPGFGRDDDRDNVKVGFTYDWKYWLTVGLSYTRDERESNVAQFDYERDIALLSFDVAL
jgi:hypothetical protein